MKGKWDYHEAKYIDRSHNALLFANKGRLESRVWSAGDCTAETVQIAARELGVFAIDRWLVVAALCASGSMSHGLFWPSLS